jgi:hypothetical protein
MKWRKDIDEHDQPTEPMMPVWISPPSANGVNETLATSKAGERALPGQVLPVRPAYRSPEMGTPVYPVLPPAPSKSKKGTRPSGGALPTPVSPASSSYPVRPGKPNSSAEMAPVQPRRSPFPVFVGMFFVAVQLLLLVRFVLKLLGLTGNEAWVGLIYSISNIFILPFYVLFQSMNLPLANAFEIYTLLAILLYGFFSRILVRFLKALLNSR